MKRWWIAIALLSLAGSFLVGDSKRILGVIFIYGAMRIAEIVME